MVTIRFSGIILISFAALILRAEIPASCNREVRFPSAIHDTNNPIPKWSRGYLVHRKINPAPVVDLYDRNGQRAYSAEISLPGAVRINVLDAAVDSRGRAAVVTLAWKDDGTTAFLLVLLGSDGRITRAIQTNPFHPFRVEFGADGSLWALGGEFEKEKASVEYNVLRHYSPDGTELGSFLPRSTFAKQPFLDPASVVQSAGDRIAVFSAMTNEWVELTQDGVITGAWRLPPNINGLTYSVRRAFLGGSATAFVELFLGPSREKQTEWEVYRLDRERSDWKAVAGTKWRIFEWGILGMVLGMDGDELVFQDRHDPVLVHWCAFE